MHDPNDIPSLEDAETEDEVDAAMEQAILTADQNMDTDR